MENKYALIEEFTERARALCVPVFVARGLMSHSSGRDLLETLNGIDDLDAEQKASMHMARVMLEAAAKLSG